MRIVIAETENRVADYVAEYAIKRIKDFDPTPDRPFVLGLPTGSTPIKLYQRLIQAYREGRISFKNVVTFNMDEYVGLPEDHPQSYHYFMKTNLFSFIDIRPENVNIPNGNALDLVAECQRYEDKISSVGGINLFLGGVGSDGHIAFNEPGSSLVSLTRVKSLNEETIAANARFFDDDVLRVPNMALTVGIQTIMNAKEVIIMATGIHKSVAVAQAVEGQITHAYPVTALQQHRKVIFVLDDDATMELRVKTVKYFRGLALHEHDLEKRQENARRLPISNQSKL